MEEKAEEEEEEKRPAVGFRPSFPSAPLNPARCLCPARAAARPGGSVNRTAAADGCPSQAPGRSGARRRGRRPLPGRLVWEWWAQASYL